MRTFDQNIIKAFKEGLITEEVASSYATKKSVVKQGIDWVKSTLGQETSTIVDLAMDASDSRYGWKNDYFIKIGWVVIIVEENRVRGSRFWAFCLEDEDFQWN